MDPAVAVLFMSGVILTIVGSGRAFALRGRLGVVATDKGGTQPIPLYERPDVATMLWLATALYGLFLASAGVILGR